MKNAVTNLIAGLIIAAIVLLAAGLVLVLAGWVLDLAGSL